MAALRFLTLSLAIGAALSLECGEFSGRTGLLQTELEERIVNGEVASLGEFPWQISMQRKARAKVQGAGSPPLGNGVTELSDEEEETLDTIIWGRFLWEQLAAEKNISFDQIANWPPPIPPLPTHPPHHTIPPLPTHPPNQRLPSYPPMPPVPTFPPPSSGVKPWNPQPAPKPWQPPQQRPPQYPPLPTLPPRPSPTPRPNPLPTLPPRPSQSPKPNPLPTLPPKPSPVPTQPPRSTQPPRPNPPPIPTQKPQPQPQPPKPQPPKPRPPIDRTQKWQHFCGGSIIDNSWILTAAHCVESMKYSYTPGTIRIVAGSIDWRNIDEQNAQVIPVDRIIVHDGWSQQSGQNDVALLHLQSPIDYIKTDKVVVNKICLSRVSDREHSGMATSSGWGFLNKDHRVTPDMMRRVDIPVVDHNTCRNAFSRVIGISQNQVCAGQSPRGNCMGDSGGPLVQKMGNKATQIGIVSFSIPCAVPGYPDVFTRVAKYIDWIASNTGLPL